MAQQVWDTIIIRASSDSKGRVTTYEELNSFYNDLLVFKVNANLELQWMKQIPHGDYSVKIPKIRRPYSNYNIQTYQKQQGKHYFFYYVKENPDINITDDMSKKEQKKAKKIMKKAAKATYCDVIDETDGSYKTIKLFNIRNVEGEPVSQYKLRRTRVAEDGSIISEAYRGGKQDILIKNSIH